MAEANVSTSAWVISMLKKAIAYTNYVLLTVAMLLALRGLWLLMFLPSAVEEPVVPRKEDQKKQLPPLGFHLTPEQYAAIGGTVLETKFVAPTISLPDLRSFLSYFGTNDRPDIASKQNLMHFGLKDIDQMGIVAPDEPLYVVYDRARAQGGRYTFSLDNHPTHLWIEGQPGDNKATVRVKMTDDNGQPITTPAANSEFSVPLGDYARLEGGKWEIAKQRVDGTLLARQRARWLGQDLFINKHGGDEFKDQVGKERIEFGEKEDKYAVYVKEEDCLIWDGNRWVPAQIGLQSRQYPLMCVKKIDDRLMRLQLWDVGGKGRVALNLIKTTEPWTPQSVVKDFQFLSARTLSQYIFEVRKERVTLRPFDWLLLTDKGWKQISTPDDIDALVDRKLSGPLFILDGVTKKDEKQVLQASFYSPQRTKVEVVLYPLDQQGGLLAPIKGTTEEEAKPKVPQEESPVTRPESPPSNKPVDEESEAEMELPGRLRNELRDQMMRELNTRTKNE